MTGWIGVDLDGTLARYDGWKGKEHIGAPIAPMVERVKAWLARGITVRIVTARVSDERDAAFAREYIEAWCLTHLGQTLDVTSRKDFGMIALYDDRAVRVEHNTGRILSLDHTDD